MAYHKIEETVGGVSVSLETGRIAKQANGAVIARIGDTMVLATACSGNIIENTDFFPLTVEYIAKNYAAGKIPGGYFKREGKPSEKEVLSARLVDRPLRPLFPKGLRTEIQIIASVISADETYDADVMAITAASCALCLSDIPFAEPVAAVRVGMVDGALKVFPTLAEIETARLDLIVAGSETSIVMVEGNAGEISEDVIVDAIGLAHGEIKKLVAMQKDLMAKTNVVRPAFTPSVLDEEILAAVSELVKDTLHDISFIGDKKKRYAGMKQLLADVQLKLAERFPEKEKVIAEALHELEKKDIRSTIIEKGVRIAGRDCDTIRQITCDLDILPRAHGSALFTRGETQALVATTLGTKLDEQHIDDIQGEYDKSYMLHYNFPPFSVGEVKRLGSVSRREVGHGHLAETSLSPILPNEKSFPYTIRIVSEIMESNGSSSMATVCGASLSLMAAGVPVKSHVAGVAMGLIKEGDRHIILTDILGTEDHVGDMDFKVAGTREGVTAIQMDIKIAGVTPQIMRDALAKANTARNRILDIMYQAIPEPRKDLCEYAPRITAIRIDKEKIREIIGPGGKIVRDIQETTGTTIVIEDDGTVQVAAANKSQRDAALKRIRDIVAEPELGAIYDAKVKSIVDFGAFVEFLPGKEGLVHISELDLKRVNRTEDVVKMGDVIRVKLIGFDRFGKVKLSKKALMTQP
ncbi:MAG: polyribonucleotide nucleotidyltransferase [Chitinivibrionales bacterium]